MPIVVQAAKKRFSELARGEWIPRDEESDQWHMVERVLKCETSGGLYKVMVALENGPTLSRLSDEQTTYAVEVMD